MKELDIEIKKIYDEAKNPFESENCICRYELPLRPEQKVYVHLPWCPDSYVTKEYNALPWWKKIFREDPASILHP